jgi:hypothetical protein
MRHLLLIALVAATFAAEPVSLLPDDSLSAFTFNSVGQTGRREMLTVSNQSFATALRVLVREQPKLPYAVNLLCPVEHAVATGDTLELDLWARGEPGDGATETAIAILHQKSERPWTSLVNKRLVLNGAWTRHRLAYRAVADYAAGDSRIALFFGVVGPQTVEVAAITCRNHGPTVTPESLGILVVPAPVPNK